ncbi:hypothetical protein H6G81_09385 [Scytonema hofmannii FACHB-248]|uniref:Uncharacterized protein n=1 Tax=Scytonema hofmannii FACHB-248 TaxID=1842502 RepID=A0ABR8GMV2_9CYAN|nr:MULTISPECIES: hypothetical protein [Nostocales]MBD2604737.1 hypothetical protein [Scytonema hofmannii FACHB-248]
MGRWTPLILMAGGLAILLGTLLGINFPMGVQNASAPTVKGRSQVLPANINVNSTASGSNGENGNSVAQNNTQESTSQNNQEQTDNTPDPTTDNSQSGDNQSTDPNSSGPVRALW